MSKTPIVALAALSSLFAACSSPKPVDPVVDPTPQVTAEPVATASATADATAAPTAEPPKPPPPTPAVKFSGGLATPESVYYDAAGDRYLVSNINGKPVDADNNGFISELTPDGGIKTPKWIEGGQKKVTLNAPKGMAVVKGERLRPDGDRMAGRRGGAQ